MSSGSEGSLYWELVPRSGTDAPTYWWSGLRYIQAYQKYEAIRGVIQDIGPRIQQQIPLIRFPVNGDRPGAELAVGGFITVEEKRQVSLLNSELLHHLRSSLDYLVYNAAWKNKGRPVRGTQFPVCADLSAWNDARKKAIKQLNGLHVGWIRGAQPFEGATWARDIQTLSNADKHRFAVELAPSLRFRSDSSHARPDPNDSGWLIADLDQFEIHCRLIETGPYRDVMDVFDSMFSGAADVLNLFFAEEGISRIEVTPLSGG